MVDEIPAENVTTHVTDSRRNRVISGALRVGSRAGHGRLSPAWRPVADWLSRHLQREQNLRRPLQRDQREALLPQVAADVRLLEEVTGDPFGDWLDGGHAQRRASLRPVGKIGTGYRSIDDPFGEAAGRSTPQRSSAANELPQLTPTASCGYRCGSASGPRPEVALSQARQRITPRCGFRRTGIFRRTTCRATLGAALKQLASPAPRRRPKWGHR